MAGQKGRPRDSDYRWPREMTHRLRIEFPEDFLSQQDATRIPREKIFGAALTAAGVFMLTMITASMVKGALAGVLAFGVTAQLRIINFFAGVIGKKGTPEELMEDIGGNIVQKVEQALPGTTTLSVSLALTAGGMVLAGLNPGRVLGGIGDIIDGLIPG